MKDVVKIGILDDEEPPRILIEEIVASIPGYQIAFSSGDPFLGLELIKNGAIDILISDIVMPGFSGLELTRRILSLGIQVIFCSAHGRYGVDSYQVNAAYFILKPPSFFEVSNALQRAKSFMEKGQTSRPQIFDDVVMIKQAGDSVQVMVKPSQVLYIEQKGSYTFVCLESGEEVRTRNTFAHTLERIKRPYIYKVHRSYAVNYLKMKYSDSAFCYFGKEKRIPISKEYRKDFFDFLEEKTQS